MIKLPSIMKTPQHRRFSIKTRYYDAEKEAFNERIERARQEAGSDLTEVDALRNRMRAQFRKKRDRKAFPGAGQSNLRIILIIAILGALSYLILK